MTEREVSVTIRIMVSAWVDERILPWYNNDISQWLVGICVCWELRKSIALYIAFEITFM